MIVVQIQCFFNVEASHRPTNASTSPVSMRNRSADIWCCCVWSCHFSAFILGSRASICLQLGQ